jgi:hypothetical protein
MPKVMISFVLAGALAPAWAGPPQRLDAAAAARFAELALDCIHREYPNKISHVLNSADDAKPPNRLTPVFYGCYDWHSAVHGHWLLVRLCRTTPDASFVGRARAALATSFTREKIAAELAYLHGEGRGTFERPYGLAWLLQLSAELHEWDDPQARAWATALDPLEREAAARFKAWLPKLSHPVRTGERLATFARDRLFGGAKRSVESVVGGEAERREEFRCDGIEEVATTEETHRTEIRIKLTVTRTIEINASTEDLFEAW